MVLDLNLNLNHFKWVFPKIGVPQNGWFIMESPFEMDDLGENPLFLETPILVSMSLHLSRKLFFLRLMGTFVEKCCWQPLGPTITRGFGAKKTRGFWVEFSLFCFVSFSGPCREVFVCCFFQCFCVGGLFFCSPPQKNLTKVGDIEELNQRQPISVTCPSFS